MMLNLCYLSYFGYKFLLKIPIDSGLVFFERKFNSLQLFQKQRKSNFNVFLAKHAIQVAAENNNVFFWGAFFCFFFFNFFMDHIFLSPKLYIYIYIWVILPYSLFFWWVWYPPKFEPQILLVIILTMYLILIGDQLPVRQVTYIRKNKKQTVFYSLSRSLLGSLIISLLRSIFGFSVFGEFPFGILSHQSLVKGF